MTRQEAIDKVYGMSGTKEQHEALEFLIPEVRELREFYERQQEDERIRKKLINFLRSPFIKENLTDEKVAPWLEWLEKQGVCDIDYPQKYQDNSQPSGCIVLEDFNGGEGFYKLNLDYLNKKQVEEVEEMVRTWNKESKVSNENIKACIGMCLTDANEQRFKDYNTSLKDCLAYLEKQKEPDYLNKFTKLPHLNSDYEVVDDWAYTPSLCHCDGNWTVCWIHCEDGDVLHECIGDTPVEAIDKAVEWFTSLNKQIPVKKVGAIISSRDKEETACGYLERCLTPDMRKVWYEACDELKKACFQEAEKQKEQKPVEWSEEDECFV